MEGAEDNGALARLVPATRHLGERGADVPCQLVRAAVVLQELHAQVRAQALAPLAWTILHAAIADETPSHRLVATRH